MAAVRAAGLQTELSEGQCHIVANDEQPALVNVLLVQPVAHGITAQVHEGGGLEQKDLTALHRRLCHKAVATVVKNNIGRLCESVQYHESCIVAGHVVLLADISQSYNKILVHYSAPSSAVAAEREARVAFTEQTTTSGDVAMSRPSKLSSPTLMLLPSCRLVTSMSSTSGMFL